MRKVLFILGQLSDDDVEWLGRVGVRQRLAKGDVLVEQARRIDAMYIVLDGRLSVSLARRGEIARLGSGEIVGEMSLIDSRPPTATVTALEDAILLAVPQAALEAKVAADPAFAARFYRALATFLSDRMRGTLLRLGYGDGQQLDEDVEQEGELDDNVLDNVSLAGARFDRMLKRLLGASAPPG